MAIDQDRLNQFMQQAVSDIGAAFHAAMVVIGDKLGLYKELAKSGLSMRRRLRARLA
jgi:hypothetical protein